MGAKRDELVDFAPAEDGSNRRDAERSLLEAGKGCRVLNETVRKKMAWASAVDNVDGVLLVEREGELVVVLGVLVGENDVRKAYAGEAWEEKRMRSTCLA